MDKFQNILAQYSKCDNHEGTDKSTSHSYDNLYSSIFLKIDPVNILEIGVFSGAFLEVLSKYFSDAKAIIGIDITLRNVIFGKHDPRIVIYERNGSSLETAEEIGNKYISFDLIIEDGSHLLEDQIATLNNFARFISKKGVYIIEDINVGKYPTIKDDLNNVAKNNNLIMTWYDMRDVKGRYDDVVAVFKHSSNFIL